MKIESVRYHVLRNYDKKKNIAVDGMSADRVQAEMRENLVAFTCLLASPSEGVLYCGITAFNNDILHAFDLGTGKFRSLGYASVAEKFEVKVHRSLEMDSDGTIYGASACLHDVSRRIEAPGGAVFRLTKGDRRIEKLCIPCKHDYIQTITLDRKRRLIYGFTEPVFKMFIYDINRGEAKDMDYIGSITHISALDDSGRIWGTWDEKHHYLFCYDPRTGRFEFTRNKLPRADGDANRMYTGAGPVDSMINGGDGYLYIGSTGGVLYRLDPKKGEAEWLGKPFPLPRMPGLKVWKDSLLVGITGDGGAANVFAYDRENGRFFELGPVAASSDGLRLYRPHDLEIVGGNTLFIAETDVPDRSGFLWECRVSA